MYRLILSLLCALLPVWGDAASQPVAFARGTVLLVPTQSTSPQYHNGVLFGVDIRDFGSVHNPAWFQFAGIAEGKGLLLTLARAEPVIITSVPHFAPLDILLLDDYGVVLKILPNLVLSTLQESIASDAPVLAVLYLKGGTVDVMGVKPGDHVRHKMFRTRPEVRSTTPTAP